MSRYDKKNEENYYFFNGVEKSTTTTNHISNSLRSENTIFGNRYEDSFLPTRECTKSIRMCRGQNIRLVRNFAGEAPLICRPFWPSNCHFVDALCGNFIPPMNIDRRIHKTVHCRCTDYQYRDDPWPTLTLKSPSITLISPAWSPEMVSSNWP